jgi:hypothetical protein
MSKLVTFQLYEALYSNPVNFADIYMNTESTTKVDWEDKTSGTHLVFTGEDFKVSHGLIDSGTIDSIAFRSYSGKLLANITGLHIDAQTLGGDTGLLQATDALQHVVNSNLKVIGTALDDSLTLSGIGNDQIFGKAGDDTMGGGKGKDVMTGGSGNDTFNFNTGDGKDTITDFHPDGGPGAQDLINATFADVTSIDQVGANTVIHFGIGDSLTLLHVDHTHIDSTDFV